MSPAIRREYARLRALGWRASDALRDAKTRVSFATMERAGHVRLRIVPDEEGHDASYVDTWDSEKSPAWIARTKREILRTVERDGLWGVVGEYLSVEGTWVQSNAVWDFVGDSWKDSGYDGDIMRATMAAWCEEHAAQVSSLAMEAC